MKRTVFTWLTLLALTVAVPVSAQPDAPGIAARHSGTRASLPGSVDPLPLVGLGGLVAFGGAVWLTRRRSA